VAAPHGADPGLGSVGGQQRCQLLVDGTVVATGVALPVRSYRGRAPVSPGLLVVCSVNVVEGHEQDPYGATADDSRTSDGGLDGDGVQVFERGSQATNGNESMAEDPRTLGAAACAGEDLLWRVNDIG